MRWPPGCWSKAAARGVEYTVKGKPTVAYADREVVLSGGSVNSPRLLLLSGIGPADELGAVGINTVHNLPGVGKNFQDHMHVYLTAETTPVSYNESDRPFKALAAGIQYVLYRTGPVTASVCEAGMFVRSSSDVVSPDIQMHCLPAFVVGNGRMRIRGHGMTINTCNLRPKSVGSVTLRSADPAVPPAIDPNFLSDPYDWKISLEGFKWGREMLATKAYAPFIKREHMPGAEVRTDAQIRDYVRQWAKTDYHPVGSCKMGERNGLGRPATPSPRPRRSACHRRLHHADADQRKHPSNLDHDRRERCTPHPARRVVAAGRALAAPPRVGRRTGGSKGLLRQTCSELRVSDEIQHMGAMPVLAGQRYARRNTSHRRRTVASRDRR